MEMEMLNVICFWLVYVAWQLQQLSLFAFCNSGVNAVSLDFLLHALNLSMMTSLNGNIFRVTGPLGGEFTGNG